MDKLRPRGDEAMIYTLTTNPAIDMNCSSSSNEPFKVNRTTNLSYSPNGKGVNVSLVLNHYSIESKALGFSEDLQESIL